MSSWWNTLFMLLSEPSAGRVRVRWVMLNYAGEYCEYGEYCDARDA